MKFQDSDRVIALSGVFQAAGLVQQVARKGLISTEKISTSINSLFQLEANSVVDVYGTLEDIAPGLKLTYKQLSASDTRDDELTRYVLSLIQLERKLSKHRQRLDKIRAGITETAARLIHFPATHSNILGALADIYAENISTLKPRIMVSGETIYLQNSDNVNRIRALLLSGIRSAMLWRQTGGRRRQLLFSRSNYIDNCKTLLDKL
ncbi:MAG: high frequency lysogenization protein HflD [Candidatus Thiodiazotropha sp. (ex. Lucinisca nassula)]|nr:high frequency lysogenization protein HflD [Candidatus Thiodiazotropha sp. (ex. Lucinisca nassula)]MBW9262572.1 high frequency lysogenization protein HflD [Candidatus Thiodiazotropha sp. (ex. Lucinisca nassula)]MBW9269315.1 high frequency lysogenization protein HflD [Candidatus Thiodiazotropha sp. (ex. Lucinisca nassula)]